MKKIAVVLIGLFWLMSSHSIAATGDTTWVTIYNLRKITQYGNYDTSAVLPSGKTYRKIRLHYILGRYACPAGTQYCGSWDYTTQLWAKPANADTVEIARVITPYANDWPMTRKHDYIIDVTDYASVLNGNLDFRYKYDGYSWGFTITLKLELIEGTPAQEATSAKNIYDGYFAFGNVSDPIENHLVSKSFSYLAPNTKAIVKNTISGHGSDDNECGEFCSKYYNLLIDGATISQKQIWKNDCGLNNISPQTGTWLYDRANWCPGQTVYPFKHDISSVTSANTPFSVNMDMEAYVSPTQTNTGGYNIVSQLITYNAPNFVTDASIEDIISPTNDPNYARSNTSCANAKIKLKNTGTTNLTNVVFSYSVTGGVVATYTWTGNLSFLEETEVEFNSGYLVYNGNTTNQFYVNIVSVNGVSGDDNSFNNTYQSTYNSVKVYPTKFVLYFSTNAATSTINPGYNEGHWVITDNVTGNVVASRSNLNNSTVYRDTMNLPDGCYTFTMDDDGCDGISWWAYQYYTPNPGSGILKFNKLSPAIPLKTFVGDFGCQTSERFMISSSLTTNINEQNVKTNFTIFPNPTAGNFNLMLDVSESQSLKYTITNVSGMKMKEGELKNVGSDSYFITTENLANGIYFVKCQFSGGEIITKKLIINQ